MSCDRFRRRFSRGERDEIDLVHLETCDECSEFAGLAARHLAEGEEPPPPMSDRLVRSLREIPEREVACHHVLRLYRQAVSVAGAKPADAAAVRHLEHCEQCAALFTVLRRGLSIEQLKVSERLVASLMAFARVPRRALPLWIRDIRYAAVACYVTAMLSSLVAGEASALFSETTIGVGTKASEWVDRSESRSRRFLSRVEAAAHRSYDFVKAHFEVVQEISSQGLFDVERGFESSKTYELLIRYLPPEGDNDGTANRQSTER